VPLVALGLFWWDALAYMVDVNFDRIERSDAQIALTHPVSARAVAEVGGIRGAIAAEGQRIVPARLRNGHRVYRTSLQGLPANSRLKVPRQTDLTPLAIPAEGVILSTRLAERLSVAVGDEITIEALEGARPVRQIRVTGVADDILGLNGYMKIGALNRLMRESDVVNVVAVAFDPVERRQAMQKLQELPKVETVASRSAMLAAFNDNIAALVITSAVILTGFGVLIAAGVVYNAARVAFHERAWELASLRILGFTRNEVAAVLFAELMLLVGLAVPLGLWLARWIIDLIVHARDNESFQLPAIISPFTLGLSAIVVVAAAALSAIMVRRRIDRLDLVAVLKTRD
jgi:putative ABC transport system permease protein